MLQCGIDEAGRGPVIGPMIIAMVCADDRRLERLGVRDSKTLSPATRERLYDKIMEASEKVAIESVSPAEINAAMKTTTLNEIEYQHYLKLIVKTTGNVYLDCFDVLTGRAEERFLVETGRKVKCEHKADQKYPAVSAASIIAKVTRDREIEKLKEKYGETGSGYPSDPLTISFLRKALAEKVDISDIVRTAWSTYRRLRSEYENRKLF